MDKMQEAQEAIIKNYKELDKQLEEIRKKQKIKTEVILGMIEKEKQKA